MGIEKWNRVAIPERVKERAHSRWELDGDCWISTYSSASHGYAQIGWNDPGERHVVLAHRASWEFENGPMEIGLTLDHRPTCKSRKCVNPAHLRVLTNLLNSQRTRGLDWPLGTCVRGHPNSERVPKPGRKGRTMCGKCSRIWQERHRKKRALSKQIAAPNKEDGP